jgi:hypothetical protein
MMSILTGTTAMTSLTQAGAAVWSIGSAQSRKPEGCRA